MVCPYYLMKYLYLRFFLHLGSKNSAHHNLDVAGDGLQRVEIQKENIFISGSEKKNEKSYITNRPI